MLNWKRSSIWIYTMITVCTLRVIERGKIEVHSWMENFDRESRTRNQLLENVNKLVKEMITSVVETQLDEKMSMTDVKKHFKDELRSVGKSSASAANALNWEEGAETQSTERRLLCTLRRCTALCWTLVVQFRLGLWRWWDTWSADFSHVWNMWRQRVSAESERVVAKRWSSSMSQRYSWRSRNTSVNIMSIKSCLFLDRSNEVVVRMTVRVVKARIVCRVQKEQWDEVQHVWTDTTSHVTLAPAENAWRALTSWLENVFVRIIPHSLSFMCAVVFASVLSVFLVLFLSVSLSIPCETSWHTRSKWNISTNRTKKTTFETIWSIKPWTSVNTDCDDQTCCITLLRRSECQNYC